MNRRKIKSNGQLWFFKFNLFFNEKKIVTRPFESTNRIRLFKIARYSVSNYQQRILMKRKKRRAERNSNKIAWISFTIRLLILACKILAVLCFWSSLYFDRENIVHSTYTCLHMCHSHTYSFIFATQLCLAKTNIINSFLLRRTIPFVRSPARPSIRFYCLWSVSFLNFHLIIPWDPLLLVNSAFTHSRARIGALRFLFVCLFILFIAHLLLPYVHVFTYTHARTNSPITPSE